MRRLKAKTDGVEKHRAQKEAIIEAVKQWVSLVPDGKFLGTQELSTLISPDEPFALSILQPADVQKLQAEGYGKKGTNRFKSTYGNWAYPNLWGKTVPTATKVVLAEDELPKLPGPDGKEQIEQALLQQPDKTAPTDDEIKEQAVRDWGKIAKGQTKGWGARKNLMYGRPNRG